jgi:hypothetical protein
MKHFMIMLLIVLSSLTGGLVAAGMDYYLLEDEPAIQTIVIHRRANGSENSVSGVNFEGIGYFVVTAGQDMSEVLDTDYHEACHELINQDEKNHFCRGE